MEVAYFVTSDLHKYSCLDQSRKVEMPEQGGAQPFCLLSMMAAR